MAKPTVKHKNDTDAVAAHVRQDRGITPLRVVENECGPLGPGTRAPTPIPFSASSSDNSASLVNL